MDARHDRVIVVRAAERTAGPQTPGMRREEAFATDDLWAGLVTTEPGTVSAWHHHGEYETAVYVLAARCGWNRVPAARRRRRRTGRLRPGAEGRRHREQPVLEPAEVIAVRAGGGSTFNVVRPRTEGRPVQRTLPVPCCPGVSRRPCARPRRDRC
jgi:hypothetical protein